MELSQIVYTSDSTHFINGPLIKDILFVAQEHNTSKNISGILASHNMNFLQALEGDKETIKNLYGNIAKDERHHNVTLLDFSPIAKRSYGDWSMQGFNFDKLPKERQRHVFNEYCKGNEEFHLPSGEDACLALLEYLKSS